jgi:hypothetical protein
VQPQLARCAWRAPQRTPCAPRRIPPSRDSRQVPCVSHRVQPLCARTPRCADHARLPRHKPPVHRVPVANCRCDADRPSPPSLLVQGPAHTRETPGNEQRSLAQAQMLHCGPRSGSVSKVDMATRMPLIYKIVFPSISTFETPPFPTSIQLWRGHGQEAKRREMGRPRITRNVKHLGRCSSRVRPPVCPGHGVVPEQYNTSGAAADACRDTTA